MILLTRGQVCDAVVTVTEKVTLPNPYFLLVFTHDLTKVVVSVVLPDQSIYPDRFNRFAVDGTLFSTADDGFYTYRIYEQDDDENTDPSLAGACLEVGKAKLIGDKSQVTQYDGYPNEFVTYGK